MTTSVHPNAQAGFATGTSESYDRVRPSYPADCVSYVRSQVPKSTTPLKIVEIGAGTGIFTRALLTHPEWDDDEGMRNFWTKCVQDHRCTITGWADLIIIAQAFHWCLDYGKAFTEFARILNKDGAAVFVWYLADREAAGWVAQVQHCIEARGNGSPRFRLDVLRQAFSTPEYTSLFHPQEEKQWGSSWCCYRANLSQDRVLSWSYIATEGIKVILERGDGKVWINKEQGTYQDPHMARVMISRKK
ncbi:hypothetical protein F4604DRAFT_1876598 [Suillus subluteus]|nr:hypothetical protein F4604DRAFT_1876598 [Suillus subluteus]